MAAQSTEPQLYANVYYSRDDGGWFVETWTADGKDYEHPELPDIQPSERACNDWCRKRGILVVNPRG